MSAPLPAPPSPATTTTTTTTITTTTTTTTTHHHHTTTTTATTRSSHKRNTTTDLMLVVPRHNICASRAGHVLLATLPQFKVVPGLAGSKPAMRAFHKAVISATAATTRILILSCSIAQWMSYSSLLAAGSCEGGGRSVSKRRQHARADGARHRQVSPPPHGTHHPISTDLRELVVL
jgi:hypothetical protein